MPIGKDQWDGFLAVVARNSVRRERGQQPRGPSPTCEACQGTGWVTPWFDDLGLADRVTYITPRYEFGQAHRDGTALVLGRDLEETVANIARFSKKDAATFRAWNAQAYCTRRA